MFIKIYYISSNIVRRLILNDIQAYFGPEVARLWHGSFPAAELGLGFIFGSV